LNLDMALPGPIERSFEIAAERCEDLTPLVYRRLFDEHPEARTMFRTEGSELVKGSMLALTIDAILDFAGERTGHFRLITSEVSSHDAYGTPREMFIAFFAIIAATLRELAGSVGPPKSMRRGTSCSATSKVSLQCKSADYAPSPRRISHKDFPGVAKMPRV
jgi:hemoglobin-like flavoprotein